MRSIPRDVEVNKKVEREDVHVGFKYVCCHRVHGSRHEDTSLSVDASKFTYDAYRAIGAFASFNLTLRGDPDAG